MCIVARALGLQPGQCEQLLIAAGWSARRVADSLTDAAAAAELWQKAGLPPPTLNVVGDSALSQSLAFSPTAGDAVVLVGGSGVRTRTVTAAQFSLPPQPSADADADSSTVVAESAESSFVSCSICLDDEVAPSDMLALWCGHSFCRSCWRRALLGSPGPHTGKRCLCHGAAGGCTARATTEFLAALGAPAALLETAQEEVVSSYVWAQPELVSCAAGECQALVLIAADAPSAANPSGSGSSGSSSSSSDDAALPAAPPSLLRSQSTAPASVFRCPLCAFEKCTRGCLFPAHDPAPCRVIRWWLDDDGFFEVDEDGEEAMTKRLLLISTKPCPMCHYPVEKREGCKYVFA